MTYITSLLSLLAFLTGLKKLEFLLFQVLFTQFEEPRFQEPWFEDEFQPKASPQRSCSQH